MSDFITWDKINFYNAGLNPSEVHSLNTGLSNYFARYLYEEIAGAIKINGAPESWAMNYFKAVLLLTGHEVIFKTDKFGVIPQQATLGGYNVFYQPQYAIVTNPLILDSQHLIIGEDCAVIKMTDDYIGVWDLISTYADQLALCLESMAMNLVNSKLAYVFICGNKAIAESFKKLFDQIASGAPAAFADKSLFNEDNTPNWDVFANNLRNNFIAPEILDLMRSIDDRFKREIGITAPNTEKRERLITDEATAADRTKINSWIEELNSCFRKANKMFGLNLSASFNGDSNNARLIP